MQTFLPLDLYPQVRMALDPKTLAKYLEYVKNPETWLETEPSRKGRKRNRDQFQKIEEDISILQCNEAGINKNHIGTKIKKSLKHEVVVPKIANVEANPIESKKCSEPLSISEEHSCIKPESPKRHKRQKSEYPESENSKNGLFSPAFHDSMDMSLADENVEKVSSLSKNQWSSPFQIKNVLITPANDKFINFRYSSSGLKSKYLKQSNYKEGKHIISFSFF